MSRHELNRRDLFIGALSTIAVRRGSAAINEHKLAASCIGANTYILGLSLYQAIDVLGELGFPVIEIQPMGQPNARPGKPPGFQFDQITKAEKERIRQALRGFMHITTHLPYQGLSFFSRASDEAQRSIRQLRIAMEATAFFGAGIGVLHVTRPKGWNLAAAWPSIVSECRRLGDLAAEGNFRLAIETGFPESVRDFVRLIKDIDHESVGAAVDVGHQIRYQEFEERTTSIERSSPKGIRAYNDVMHEIIDQLGPKLIHLHVHDIDPGTWKDHRPIGLDVIDYPRLIRKLNRVRYTGWLVLEISAEDMRSALADNKRRLERFLADA